ncbi:AAA family ATPase [Desulfotruncus alcoholivorax]|uniref:AAA family ATPase n=1 Tax=Desulfotruncus alcoholivorax TaxID=265477 RepID=UPI0004270D3A|nr:AAA family ATPase [Desulfotruncus alcoholivorax]
MKAVAVYGFTTGSGKTTTAKELAGYRQRQGYNTLLVDMDLSQGKLTEILGLKKTPNIGDWLNDIFNRLETTPCWKKIYQPDEISKFYQSHSSGLKVITTNFDHNHCNSPLLLNGIDIIVRSLKTTAFDTVIFDTNNAMRDYTLDLMFRMDKVLMIADFLNFNRQNAEILLRLLIDEGFSKDCFGFVLNRFPTFADESPEQISNALGIPLYGVLPNCPDLTGKKKQGKIFSTCRSTRFTEEIGRIAQRLV